MKFYIGRKDMSKDCPHRLRAISQPGAAGDQGQCGPPDGEPGGRGADIGAV